MLNLKFPTKFKSSSECTTAVVGHSEPYHRNQNPCEWCYKTIKAWTNMILNRTGAPANCWLLCISYVCYLLNHIFCESLKGQIPLTKLDSVTPDISIILMYSATNLFAMHPITNLSLPLVRKNMLLGLVLVTCR